MYQTDKVVAKAKNDPELVSIPESSSAARLFRYLVESKRHDDPGAVPWRYS